MLQYCLSQSKVIVEFVKKRRIVAFSLACFDMTHNHSPEQRAGIPPLGQLLEIVVVVLSTTYCTSAHSARLIISYYWFTGEQY